MNSSSDPGRGSLASPSSDGLKSADCRGACIGRRSSRNCAICFPLQADACLALARHASLFARNRAMHPQYALLNPGSPSYVHSFWAADHHHPLFVSSARNVFTSASVTSRVAMKRHRYQFTMRRSGLTNPGHTLVPRLEMNSQRKGPTSSNFGIPSSEIKYKSTPTNSILRFFFVTIPLRLESTRETR